MDNMQRADATAIDVENLKPGLPSETETSDPSAVSKRRRLDPPHAGRIAVESRVSSATADAAG